MRIFGCACWPNLRPFNPRKLAFRSKRCVFLGFSSLHKGFKCLDVSTGKVYVSRDVVFDESVFPFETLHNNAGVLLRKEVSLLSENLLYSVSGGVEHTDLLLANGHNCSSSTVDNLQETRMENLEQHGLQEVPVLVEDEVGTELHADLLGNPGAESNTASPVLNGVLSSSHGGPEATPRSTHEEGSSTTQLQQHAAVLSSPPTSQDKVTEWDYKT